MARLPNESGNPLFLVLNTADMDNKTTVLYIDSVPFIFERSWYRAVTMYKDVASQRLQRQLNARPIDEISIERHILQHGSHRTIITVLGY